MNLITKLAMALHCIKASAIDTDKGTLHYEHEGNIAVGDDVFIESTDGENVEFVPAPDGEYISDIGKFIVKDGKVDAVEVAQVEDPKKEDEEPKPADKDETETPAEKTPEERIAELEEAMTALREALEAREAEFAELTTKVAEIEAKIASIEKTPADKPADKEDTEKMSREDKLNLWREVRNNLNK